MTSLADLAVVGTVTAVSVDLLVWEKTWPVAAVNAAASNHFAPQSAIDVAESAPWQAFLLLREIIVDY
jgi:hypothetical protein